MLDRVEQVGVCSEGERRDGILVTETEVQKMLVRHLVWLDSMCEGRGRYEIGEHAKGWFLQNFQEFGLLLPRGQWKFMRFQIKE